MSRDKVNIINYGDAGIDSVEPGVVFVPLPVVVVAGFCGVLSELGVVGLLGLAKLLELGLLKLGLLELGLLKPGLLGVLGVSRGVTWLFTGAVAGGWGAKPVPGVGAEVDG